MQPLQWHAQRRPIGSDIQDVISGEFFPDEDRPAVPLVREALQNAIDAGRKIERRTSPVHVRLSLRAGTPHAASPAVSSRWFGGLRAHLEASGVGLREVPTSDEPCNYLVVEDFGTPGLTGDILSDDIDGPQNNFVDFLRSDGRTRKAAGEQGSWGVGKNVFPRTSRVNTYIAYTTRSDDNRTYLMGKCILKIRKVADTQYLPPMYLAESWNDGQVPKPSEDQAVFDQFTHDFDVSREPGDPGLTLVIPWIQNTLEGGHLIEAVASEYYFAILANELRVTIDINGRITDLSAQAIIEALDNENGLSPLLPRVRLAQWALGLRDDDRVTLEGQPEADAPQKWSPDFLSEEQRADLRATLERGERIAIRVPLHIRTTTASDTEPIKTHFDVFLENDDTARGDIAPAFFRERLCINEVRRAPGASRVRSLVVIEDKPIADLLRAAEPPNHSDWAAGTSNFKGRYIHGNHVVTFVKTAVRSLVQFLRASDERPDASIAIDYFSRTLDQGNKPTKSRGRTKKLGDQPPDPPPPLSTVKRRFTLHEVESGFRLAPGEPGTTPPALIKLRMAYDTLSGSPWKQYEPDDFDLTENEKWGISIASSKGATTTVIDPNHLEVAVADAPFEVFVTGFDPNRDLIVEARAGKEEHDADSPDELHEED